MEQMIIAERLTSLRKAANLSQAKVAQLLSVSRQAVSKWESGKAEPSLACYSALAALYDTTPDLILSGTEENKKGEYPHLSGESFAERLREARTERKVSQGELAEALSVSRQSVSKWERGESEPDAERLAALSRVLDMPLAILLPCALPSSQEQTKAIAPDPLPKENTQEAAQTDDLPQDAGPKDHVKSEDPALPLRRQQLEARVREAGQRHKAAKEQERSSRKTSDALPLIAAFPFLAGVISFIASKKKKR